MPLPLLRMTWLGWTLVLATDAGPTVAGAFLGSGRGRRSAPIAASCGGVAGRLGGAAELPWAAGRGGAAYSRPTGRWLVPGKRHVGAARGRPGRVGARARGPTGSAGGRPGEKSLRPTDDLVR